jgi:hypothetical protein
MSNQQLSSIQSSLSVIRDRQADSIRVNSTPDRLIQQINTRVTALHEDIQDFSRQLALVAAQQTIQARDLSPHTSWFWFVNSNLNIQEDCKRMFPQNPDFNWIVMSLILSNMSVEDIHTDVLPNFLRLVANHNGVVLDRTSIVCITNAIRYMQVI